MSIKILKELIKIKSITTESNKEIVDFIENKLPSNLTKRYNFTGMNGNDIHYLITKISGEDSSLKPLVYSAHTDTIVPANGWKKDPYEPYEKGGRLYGLGSADIKSGVSIMIEIANTIKKSTRDIYLIFTADEELHSEVSRKLVPELPFKDSGIIVFEPTNNKIVIGQKGCIGLQVHTCGTAIHSSLTNFDNNTENNAIYKAISIINELKEYDKKISDRLSTGFGVGTLNIGAIKGGESGNIVPDHCMFKVDRRLMPQENIEDVLKEIENIILKSDPTAKIDIRFEGDSFITAGDADIVSKFSLVSEEIDKTIQTGIVPFWTEASIFNKKGTCIVFGPGETNQAHIANESIDINKYNTALKCCIEFAKK